MITLTLTFVIALSLALVFTPIVRAIALRKGAVDKPDGKRKFQQEPVALGGGIAVYLAFGLSLLAALFLRQEGEPIPARLATALAISTGLLGLVGLLDDYFDIRARNKFLLQILASLPIALAGFHPEYISLFGWTWQLGYLAIPMTLLWLVACANAMNLMDGLDGFASVTGITIAAAIALLSLWNGNFAIAVAAIALTGAIAGFLPFNWPGASIYLGDTGSLLIGVALGALSLLTADSQGQALPMIVPAALMAVPLWDVVIAIIRRRLKKQSMGTPDREHLHHRLIAGGYTNRQALGLISLLTIVTSIAAAFSLFWQWDFLAVLCVNGLFAMLAAWQIFGRKELNLAAMLWAHATVKTTAKLVLGNASPRFQHQHNMNQEQNASENAHLWNQLVVLAERLGLQQLTLSYREHGQENASQSWSTPGVEASSQPLWHMVVQAYDSVADAFCKIEVLMRSDSPASTLASSEAGTLLQQYADAIVLSAANRPTERMPLRTYVPEESTEEAPTRRAA